ncbi:MAG: hypothetical protein SFV15_10645 [Polyangiaceae bacterium]|nr:hypothetical protein [Polyangiaceae bacterium]
MTQPPSMAPPNRTHERSVAYNPVSDTEGEFKVAHAHFKETLRGVLRASEIAVRHVWQHGKPLLFGVAILTSPHQPRFLGLMEELGYQ